MKYKVGELVKLNSKVDREFIGQYAIITNISSELIGVRTRRPNDSIHMDGYVKENWIDKI